MTTTEDAVFTYGERQPADGRDYYSIYTNRDGVVCAYLTTASMALLYRLRYGAHPAECRWSYSVPAGADAL